MKISITKFDQGFQADCTDLPGSPPVGRGLAPEAAVIDLFFALLFHKPHAEDSSWLIHLKYDHGYSMRCENYQPLMIKAGEPNVLQDLVNLLTEIVDNGGSGEWATMHDGMNDGCEVTIRAAIARAATVIGSSPNTPGAIPPTQRTDLETAADIIAAMPPLAEILTAGGDTNDLLSEPPVHLQGDNPWTYSRYRASLRFNGKPFAIVTPDGQNALPQEQVDKLLRALNGTGKPTLAQLMADERAITDEIKRCSALFIQDNSLMQNWELNRSPEAKVMSETTMLIGASIAMEVHSSKLLADALKEKSRLAAELVREGTTA